MSPALLLLLLDPIGLLPSPSAYSLLFLGHSLAQSTRCAISRRAHLRARDEPERDEDCAANH